MSRDARPGFHNFGMMYSDGIQPNWYLQWLGNRIEEGNVYWGDHDNHRLSGEAHIGVYAFRRVQSGRSADPWDDPAPQPPRQQRHVMLGSEWGTASDARAGTCETCW